MYTLWMNLLLSIIIYYYLLLSIIIYLAVAELQGVLGESLDGLVCALAVLEVDEGEVLALGRRRLVRHHHALHVAVHLTPRHARHDDSGKRDGGSRMSKMMVGGGDDNDDDDDKR
jgi:hypothetical protein